MFWFMEYSIYKGGSLMHGKIIKGIAGFYYVHVPDLGIYECKAKGVFRNQKIKPLVGDNVIVEILDEEGKIGNVTDIILRTNELIRPNVSNVDQAIIIFAATQPEPNLNLLDRFLIMMLKQNINTIICFNKKDIVTEKEISLLKDIYSSCDYNIVFISALENDGLKEIKELIKDKTTVLAGPSGVGKSSLINNLQPNANMETGQISEKIKRGKHTTRHSELINIEGITYIMDTPGFSSLYINDFEKEELKNYFKEFREYEQFCRFNGCVHINEPDCSVKEALDKGKISKVRYENYLLIYQELSKLRRY